MAAKTPTKREAFEKVVKTFVRSTAASMKAAHEAACMALEHFAEHGDLAWAQELHDAMPRNYVRRAAFLQWMGDFSPCYMDDLTGKLKKDRSENARPFDVPAAKAVKFWDHKPDREVAYFGGNDVVVALNRTIRRFQDAEKNKPADERATAAIAKAAEMVDEFERWNDTYEPSANAEEDENVETVAA